jgi:membrane protein required for colicin V production
MTPVDWLIAAGILISVLLGVLRGATREIVSLAGWVLALVLAYFYAESVGAALPWAVSVPLLRTALGALVILVGVLIAAALIGALLRALLVAAKLSALDRVAGGAFGLVRAGLVLGLAVGLASLTAMPRASWWNESLLLPSLQAGVAFASPLLPERWRIRSGAS